MYHKRLVTSASGLNVCNTFFNPSFTGKQVIYTMKTYLLNVEICYLTEKHGKKVQKNLWQWSSLFSYSYKSGLLISNQNWIVKYLLNTVICNFELCNLTELDKKVKIGLKNIKKTYGSDTCFIFLPRRIIRSLPSSPSFIRHFVFYLFFWLCFLFI